MSENRIEKAVADLRHAFAGQEHDMWDGERLNAAPSRTDKVNEAKRLGVEDLEPGKVDYFVAKAITTVGGPPTFRFFIPRFLANAVRDPMGGWVSDAHIILPRLADAGFDAWPPDQRSAVINAIELWAKQRSAVAAEVGLGADEWDLEFLEWVKMKRSSL